MRGSLLISFYDYEVGIADYVDIFVNGNLLRRIYSASDGLYSIPLYNGNNVTVTYYSPDNASISELTLIKKEYTSDDVNGNMGIVTTTIDSGVVFTSYSFTVSVSSKAYDFDYYFDNSIITQMQIWTEASEPILTENSDYINKQY